MYNLVDGSTRTLRVRVDEGARRNGGVSRLDRRGQVVMRDAPWGAVLCARAPRAREQLFFFFFLKGTLSLV